MRKTPASVIPISLGQRRKAHSFRGAENLRRQSARPVRALVVDPEAADRRRICRVGRQAAGVASQWFEASDPASAVQLLESSEVDFVVADSQMLGDSLDWLKPGNAAAGRAPLVVVLTEDEEPQRIQQMLDAGAECLLSKRLPQSILESELRQLVAQSARRLDHPGHPPITFPKGIHS